MTESNNFDRIEELRSQRDQLESLYKDIMNDSSRSIDSIMGNKRHAEDMLAGNENQLTPRLKQIYEERVASCNEMLKQQDELENDLKMNIEKEIEATEQEIRMELQALESKVSEESEEEEE